MKIAIEMNACQPAHLQAVAAELGVDVQQLAQSAVVDLIGTSAEDFEFAASRVLERNRELYRRLATR